MAPVYITPSGIRPIAFRFFEGKFEHFCEHPRNIVAYIIYNKGAHSGTLCRENKGI